MKNSVYNELLFLIKKRKNSVLLFIKKKVHCSI